jgi:hypothetical protein
MNVLWRRSLNIFFSSYVFHCGVSETLNLCMVVCGENPPVRFDLQCANTFRDDKIARVLNFVV